MRWPYTDPEETHRWFAWHPVVIDGQWVWLETVERYWSETFCGGRWKYTMHATDSGNANG